MMAESNDTGALLISCGNETEIALGYATLYGDMCGGVSLIGDLSKTRRLSARAVRQRASTAPRRFPTRPSTSSRRRNLPPSQFDPFDYWVVAPVVGELVERRTSPGGAGRALFEQRALDPARFVPDPDGRTVYDKHTHRDVQRRGVRLLSGGCAARCTSGCRALRSSSVTERAFGFDLRETIINAWEG